MAKERWPPSGESPSTNISASIYVYLSLFWINFNRPSQLGAIKPPPRSRFQPECRRPEIPVHAADRHLPTGFFQNETYGNRGTNYGWGIGTCVLRTPHEGVAEMLSPGSYGHGGAWGTQAWIDPVKGVAYVLMVQRSNFPNSDASDVRRDFQKAAATALVSGRTKP